MDFFYGLLDIEVDWEGEGGGVLARPPLLVLHLQAVLQEVSIQLKVKVKVESPLLVVLE